MSTTRRADDTDESPPPYSLNPADEITLEYGPARPFHPPPPPPPQQPPPLHHPPQRPQREPQRELSDFARDFYAAGDSASRSAGDLPHRTPSQQAQSHPSVPDDGRPTRTPVPGHPLLNNGKTLVYPAGYQCSKCRNTGYKSFDPSQPCRKCWDKYSKSYSGPIVYAPWNDGPSNRQKPLFNLRSSATNPSLSLTRSLSSIVNQARNDLSSSSGTSAARFHPPSSSPVYPSRPFPTPPPLPPRAQSSCITTPLNRSPSSTWSPGGRPPSAVFSPGDPRIGGSPCWNCLGSGRTFGFLLLTNNTCNLCGGIGRLL